ncbi:MAG: hypothetical protein K2J30_04590 [Clostridia bacterium]|nr:hypothetical protein [Clostridia bacterium]
MPAGNYIFTSENIIVFTNGDVEFTTGAVVTVKDGDVLSCKISLTDWAYTATVTIKEAHEIFTAEQAGTYTSADSSITLTFDKFGIGRYVAEKGLNYYGGNIIITAGENNTYSFTYLDDVTSYFNPTEVTVTFTFVDGKISITDSVVGSEAVTLEKVVSENTYSGEAEGFFFTLTLNGDLTGGTYVVDDPDGEYLTYTVTIEAADEVDIDGDMESDGAGYIATYNDSIYGECTVQFQIVDDVVYFYDGGFYKAGVLTKEA